MGHITKAACALIASLALAAGSGALGDWPQWRGPQRDGHAQDFKPPVEWPAELAEVWQLDVGLGHSSPVVAGKSAYVFTRRGEDEVLAKIDLAHGGEQWHRGYPAPYQVNPAAATHGKGPKSTPVVADGRVFTFGISGVLTAWDARSGKQLWQREFSKLYEKTSPLYGVAMSPAVDGQRCIVHVGGHDKGALVALDVQSGETLWTADEDGPAYASPIIVTLDEVRQVITQSQRACLGADVETGKILWRIPFTTEYDQNSVTPVVHEGSIIFSGINKGVERYRIEKVDGEWETNKVWENKEVSLYMSSPVADGERLFGFSHRQKGQFFALDLTTGKTLWTSDGRMGDNAALEASGKVLWGLTTRGELIAFRASDKKFDPLARYKVADSPTWAHPVIGPDDVLVKDETHLTLWRFPQDKPASSARSKAN